MEVCAALVHWDNGGVVARYIDPALAVTSAVLLIWLSHPYGRKIFFDISWTFISGEAKVIVHRINSLS